MRVGDRVRIEGKHPHADEEAVITAVHCFAWGSGVRVRLDSGEFCYVTDPATQSLVLVRSEQCWR